MNTKNGVCTVTRNTNEFSRNVDSCHCMICVYQKIINNYKSNYEKRKGFISADGEEKANVSDIQ